MGALLDYFAADSDDRAAQFIEHGPRAPAPEQPPVKRGLFRRKAAAEPTAPAAAAPSVAGRGISPLVHLDSLEELLTGRPVDVSAVPNPLASADGGERLVLPLTSQLSEALAEASDERLDEVAVPWSQAEDFWGGADPVALAAFLHGLAALARDAKQRGQRLYCWLSV